MKIADLQSLVLYLLADANAPQWVSVRNRTSIRQVVMLMVPGLELGMFNGKVPLEPVVAMDIDTPAADQVPTENASTSQGARLRRTTIQNICALQTTSTILQV